MKYRNYYEMTKAIPSDRIAITEDGREYTYGDIIREADIIAEIYEKSQPENSSNGYGESQSDNSSGGHEEKWSDDRTNELKKCQPESLMDGRKECLEGVIRLDNGICLITRCSVVEELAYFLGVMKAGDVPVICGMCPGEAEINHVKTIAVPQGAVMGVMTSGTTGIPKVLFRTMESWADYFPVQNKLFSMNENTILFAQGSLSFTGNLNLYMGLMYAGGRIVTTRKFDPRYWAKCIDENYVNYIYLIPVKMMALVKSYSKAGGQADNICNAAIKHYITGSQSFGADEARRVKTVFPECDMLVYYGASEINYITYLTDKEFTGDSRLVGRPFPEVKVTIEDDVFVVDNSFGVIGAPRPYKTNDMGFQDEEGRFYFLGRVDDIIVVNGRKLSAYKIEEALRKYLKVKNVAVKSVKNGDDEAIWAYYESEDDKFNGNYVNLRKSLAEALEAYEIPKHFVRVDELKKTESGKVLRRLV